MESICHPSTYQNGKDGRSQCILCPFECSVKNGQNGKCRVRKNVDGHWKLTNYNHVVSAVVDTIEKRPIYLYKNTKNKKSITVGLTGCNNTCPFCQNFMVSQASEFEGSRVLSPKDIVKVAKEKGAEWISFTFTEPIVWYEWYLETAFESRKSGLKVALKTAGYVNPQFLESMISVADAINLDIKPLDSNYLRKCGILKKEVPFDFLKKAYEMKTHIEISHIVIEGVNDNEGSMKEFCEEVIRKSDKNIGIHLLRHYPSFKSSYPTTTDETLDKFKEYCLSYGFENIFVNDV